MRYLIVLLIFLLSLPDARGQLFRRRDRGCPDNFCQPAPMPSDGHRDYPPVPYVKPKEEPKDEPEGAGPWSEVPEDMRPRNFTGQCAWDAGESVFGGAGYTEFKGWGMNASRIGWVGGWVTGVVKAAKDFGIETKVVQNKDYSIFDYAKAEGVPVYVQIMVNRPNDHAVCVTGLDKDYAYVLDNNGPPVVKKWPRRTFDRVWNGIACCPLHKKNKPKPVQPDNTSPVPSQPVKPVEPVKPAAPQVDLKPLTSKVDELGQAMVKLTESTSKIAEQVSTTNTRMTSVEERLTAAEKARCSCSGAGQTPASPPSVSKDDLTKVQDELARLKQTLKASGTLRINIDPRK
jgi:hypothetical protein